MSEKNIEHAEMENRDWALREDLEIYPLSPEDKDELVRFALSDPVSKLKEILCKYIDATDEELTLLVLQQLSGVDKVTHDGISIRGNIHLIFLKPDSDKWQQMLTLSRVFPKLYTFFRSYSTLSTEDPGDENVGLDSMEYEVSERMKRKCVDMPWRPIKITGPSNVETTDKFGKDPTQEFVPIIPEDEPCESLIVRGILYAFHDHFLEIGPHMEEPTNGLMIPSAEHYDAVIVPGKDIPDSRRLLLRAADLHASGTANTKARTMEEEEGLEYYLGAELVCSKPQRSWRSDRELAEAFILFARKTCNPVVPRPLLDKIRERLNNKIKEKACKDLAFIPRRFGTIIRFAEAMARARLAKEVSEQDVETAFKLTDDWIRKLADHIKNTPKEDREKPIPITKAQEPRFSLQDVIMPERERTRLQALLAQARHAKKIFEDWGLSEVIKYGKGMILLFHGAPGTGKTMAAEAVAKELGKNLLVVNNAGIISCYYGMSERNIVMAFKEAKEQNAVLLFDEVDSMLNARITVSRSTDQGINREVNTILRELENFEGFVILTTNRVTVLDEALDRRINLKLELPIPDENARTLLWKKHFSKKTPLANDVDLVTLGKEFEMAGGHIKNAVLTAARLAAHREKDVIDMATLREAAELELSGIRNTQFQKEEQDQKMKEAAVKVRGRKTTDGYS